MGLEALMSLLLWAARYGNLNINIVGSCSFTRKRSTRRYQNIQLDKTHGTWTYIHRNIAAWAARSTVPHYAK